MRNKALIKAVSIIEYCALVAILTGALIGLSVYLKRGISGHWRQAGDVFGFGRQAKAKEAILWEK